MDPRSCSSFPLLATLCAIEKDDCDEGIVVQEIQSGFTMYDRLLRPSMVGVSKKPENKKKNQKKD